MQVADLLHLFATVGEYDRFIFSVSKAMHSKPPKSIMNRNPISMVDLVYGAWNEEAMACYFHCLYLDQHHFSHRQRSKVKQPVIYKHKYT